VGSRVAEPVFGAAGRIVGLGSGGNADLAKAAKAAVLGVVAFCTRWRCWGAEFLIVMVRSAFLDRVWVCR